MSEEEIVVTETTENDTQENEVELSEEEKNQLGEDASNKFNSVLEQKKHWREKAKKAEEENKTLEAKIAGLSEQSRKEEQKSDTSKEVLITLANLERDKFLKGIAEDKRAKVQEVYTALITGKDISPNDVEDYMSIAMKAYDIKPTISVHSRIVSSANGSVPREKKQSLSKDEAELAAKFGNDPKDLENIDYSQMAGAEQFLEAESVQDVKSKSII